MKIPLFILTAACSLGLTSAAVADTNVALNSNGGTAIFGFNSGSTSTLGTPYDHAGNAGNLNDGNIGGGAGDDTYPNGFGYNGYVGAEFTLSAGTQINSLVFYGRNFVDGGWFGYSGVGPLGPNYGPGPTLTAANLIAPTLQYTTNGGITWINDSFVTNDYVAQFTGAVANGGAATNPATFTLTHPLSSLTGVDGIRLIGEEGGYAGYAPGGFLGADEIQVFAGVSEVPEPSTYALMLGGLAFLGFCVRRKSASVK